MDVDAAQPEDGRLALVDPVVVLGVAPEVVIYTSIYIYIYIHIHICLLVLLLSL